MSRCFVSADDWHAYFEGVTCPECHYHATNRDEFGHWFCPSDPDKCNGCELDPTRLECPMCLHVFPEARR